MKRERFVAGGLWIERQQERGEAPVYVAWKPHVSQLFCDAKELLRWIKWPAGTPTGDALREWLKDKGPEQGPEPNDNTRTII
jgi:hypothetical protein